MVAPRRTPFSLLVLVSVLAACGGSSGPFGGNSPFQTITVRVTNAGSGGGRVLAPDPNVQLDCQFAGAASVPSQCVDTFPDAGGGGVFTLEATPDPGSTLSGWTGCSAVAGTVCTLTFAATGFDTGFVIQAQFNPVTPNGVNLLVNPGFESAVTVGALPAAPGNWRGDQSQALSPVLGAHGGVGVLEFLATGPAGPGATFVSSEQWQIVDLSARAADVDAGLVVAEARAWFSRQAGDTATDTRFDVRLLAFSGDPSEFPASYVTPAGVKLGDQATQVLTAVPSTWQEGVVGYPVPAGTRYLVVSIYAFENIEDDATAPEFDGHYADDVSLVLSAAP